MSEKKKRKNSKAAGAEAQGGLGSAIPRDLGRRSSEEASPLPGDSARAAKRRRPARVFAAAGGLVLLVLLLVAALGGFRSLGIPRGFGLFEGNSSGSRSARGDSPFYFTDGTAASGVTFRHFDGSTGRYHIVETYASGLCLFDYDGDGDEDLYFLNGTTIDGPRPDPPPRNSLWRNLGDWRFEDVTLASGAGDTGFGLGVAAGDMDGDGDLDLYVTNWGPNVLLRNEGNGTFRDVSREAGVDDPRCGAGCAFLDIEGDGDLDLYVANYLKFDPKDSTPDFRGPVPLYRSPEHYEPEEDILYRNEGNGTFSDFTREAGIAGRKSWGMGIIAFDCDEDGDTDIFVANDVAENFLWRNDGKGHFTECAMESGCAVDQNGLEQGSMGVDVADLDGDGLLDVYQTCYSTQVPCTFRNLGGGRFADLTLSMNSGENAFGKVTWGVNLADFDLDGHVDIFLATGHVHDRIDELGGSNHYKEAGLLYANGGDGRFREVSRSSGPGFAVVESSRGSAVADLDRDGDLDLVVLNSRARPTLLQNDSPGTRAWLQIRLEGTKSNGFGVGARIRVTAGGRTQTLEVHSGRSYQSGYGLRPIVGLGAASLAERVEVRWPSGVVDVLRDVPGRRAITIREGSSPEAGK